MVIDVRCIEIFRCVMCKKGVCRVDRVIAG